jgi:hypothetical protein
VWTGVLKKAHMLRCGTIGRHFGCTTLAVPCIGQDHIRSTLGGFTCIPIFFLMLAYTEEHIAHLPDSDEENEIIDEYDTITR